MKLLLSLWGILLLLSQGFSQTHVLTFTAPDAQDATIAPLLGVISGPDPNCPDNGPMLPNVSAQYQDIGVLFVRNNDYYDDRLDMERLFRCPDSTFYPSWRCDPNDPTHLHFERSDEQFQSYLDGGFTPFFRLGGEYENCLGSHDFKGPRDSLEEENWIQAALHVIEHYNNFNGQTNVLTYLDIWTEFPGPHFWSRSNEDFYSFWARAFDSVKTHFPNLLVGGPGFVPKATLDVINGLPNAVPVEFLNELYQRGIKPDWIGWHYWNNDPATYIQAANQFRDLLNGEGDFQFVPWAGSDFFKEVKQYVDAYGTSTVTYQNGELVSMSKLERDSIYNRQKGAAILTGQWIALQYTEVELACYYRGSPQGPTSPDDDPNDPQVKISGPSLFYGDANGTPKPTAHAFRLWSRIYREFPTLLQGPLPSVNDQGQTLWVLAAKNEQNYALLVANLHKEPQPFSVVLEGQTVNTENFDRVEIFQVDNNNDGQTATLWNGKDFVIPGYTVQLLVLTPKTVGMVSQTATPLNALRVTAASMVNTNHLELKIYSPRTARAQLAIYNVLGQKVMALSSIGLTSGKQAFRIALPALPNGLYFVHLTTAFAQTNFKFLIHH